HLAKPVAFLHGSKRQHRVRNCPFCNSRVREDRLQKHMRTRCPLRPQAPTKGEVVVKPLPRKSLAAKPVRPAAQSARLQVSPADMQSGRYRGTLEVERPAWWDNLDATKNYGYPVREDGRYGSYPSHHGFDDESKP